MVGECLVGWRTIGAHHRLICVTNGCTLINITGVINSAPQTINSMDRQDDQIMVKVTTARWVVVIRMIIQDVALLMVTFSMIVVAVDQTEITTSKINLTGRKSSDQEGNKMMT